MTSVWHSEALVDKFLMAIYSVSVYDTWKSLTLIHYQLDSTKHLYSISLFIKTKSNSLGSVSYHDCVKGLNIIVNQIKIYLENMVFLFIGQDIWNA